MLPLGPRHRYACVVSPGNGDSVRVCQKVVSDLRHGGTHVYTVLPQPKLRSSPRAEDVATKTIAIPMIALWTRCRVDSARRHRFCRMRRPRLRPQRHQKCGAGRALRAAQGVRLRVRCGRRHLCVRHSRRLGSGRPVDRCVQVALPSPGLNLSAHGSDGVPFQCVDMGGGALKWAHRADTPG
jgi:hypothetical protein